MLQIQNLTITHQKDLQILVKDLSLVVNPGEKLAIIGEEGTGKSTLLKTILSPDLIGNYADVTGTIQNSFNRIGYLPQNMEEKDLILTIKNYIYHDIDFDHFDFNLFYQMAERFQFDSQRFDDDVQSISSLSGGEKLKLQLLKMLAYNPDLLLFDEPSSDLDLDTMTWLWSILSVRQTKPLFSFLMMKHYLGNVLLLSLIWNCSRNAKSPAPAISKETIRTTKVGERIALISSFKSRKKNVRNIPKKWNATTAFIRV